MLFGISLDFHFLAHITLHWAILLGLDLSSSFRPLRSSSRVIRLTIDLSKLFCLGYHLSHNSLLSEPFNFLFVSRLFVIDTISYFYRFLELFISTFRVLLLSAVLILINQWRCQITAFSVILIKTILRIFSDEVNKDLYAIAPFCFHSADLNWNIYEYLPRQATKGLLLK